MSRLIDADKLPLEPKEANQFIPYEYASGWNDMLLNVLKAEQIDAVPVVRCKKCVLHDNCVTEDTFVLAGIENPFCCAGKRKEGADNDT